MSLTAKYTGNDFLEWYKELYGKEYDGSNFTRLDGMSDHDWGIGQGLLKSYNKGKQLDDWKKSQEDELLRNYTVGVDSLANDREKALRNSYIAYEKLKKYLPMQLKAQGLGGLGVSEVSARQMNNDYLNNRGAIESSYLQKKGDLLENYNASRFNLEQDYKLDKDAWANENNGLGESIFQGYMEQDKTNKNSVRDQVLLGLDVYEAEGNAEGALKHLQDNQSAFDYDKDTYNMLVSKYTNDIQTKKEAQEKADAEAKQAEYDKNVIEGRQFVRSTSYVYSDEDGAEVSKYPSLNQYQITGEASNGDINSSRFKEGLKALGISGPSDSRLKNGTVIKVVEDSGAEWIDTFLSGLTFGANPDVISAVETTYMYYNGKWYKCKNA